MSDECCIKVEVPEPIVKRPRLVRFRGIDVGVRTGRGFSVGEIEAAGIDAALAKQLSIPIDGRRKSVHEENVESLKRFLTQITEITEAVRVKPAKNVKQTALNKS